MLNAFAVHVCGGGGGGGGALREQNPRSPALWRGARSPCVRCGCGTGFHSATEALWATPREGRISNSIWFESKGALCWSAENTPSPGGGVGWQEEGVTNRKQAIYQCGRGCWKKIMKVIFEPRYTVPPIRAQSSPTEKSSVLSATSEPHDGHRVPWLSGEKRREDELGMKKYPGAARGSPLGD